MKRLIFLPFMCILFIIACSKEDNTPDNNNSGKTDMTRYYIASDRLYTAYDHVIALPVAFIFKPNAQSVLFAPADSGGFQYKLQNGTLQIVVNELSFSWKLNNETLSDCTSDEFSEYALEKIPDTDPFADNGYTGTEYSPNEGSGAVTTVAAISNILAFKDGQFLFTSINPQGIPTITSGRYTVEVNGIATANTGNNGTLWNFFIRQGKLSFTEYNAVANTLYFGTFSEG